VRKDVTWACFERW